MKDTNGALGLTADNTDGLAAPVAQLLVSPRLKKDGFISWFTRSGICNKLEYLMSQKAALANTNEAVGKSLKYADQWMGDWLKI